jgi:predicted RND superfamily exporter protein
LAAIALVPNALPILVVMGAMGWLGLKINMGAAMIAAVSLGLSVDSSIHYLTSFQRARRAGKSVHDSLTEVQQTVGRAVVFSTLALIVGFAVLTTSDFVPTIYFGTLVSLAMLGGLAGNLVILPVLLKLFIPERKTVAS